MFGNKEKRILKTTDPAQLVPVSIFPHTMSEKGIIQLQIPKFKNETFGKLFLSKKSKPYFIIELEEPGTRVYSFINGVHTISEIINKVKSDGKEPLDQPEERIFLFIKQLFNHKYITFKQLQT
jgi:hypothetical protein